MRISKELLKTIDFFFQNPGKFDAKTLLQMYRGNKEELQRIIDWSAKRQQCLNDCFEEMP